MFLRIFGDLGISSYVREVSFRVLVVLFWYGDIVRFYCIVVESGYKFKNKLDF